MPFFHADLFLRCALLSDIVHSWTSLTADRFRVHSHSWLCAFADRGNLNELTKIANPTQPGVAVLLKPSTASPAAPC